MTHSYSIPFPFVISTGYNTLRSVIETVMINAGGESDEVKSGKTFTCTMTVQTKTKNC